MKTKTVITVLLVAFTLPSCITAVTSVPPTETVVPTSTFTPVPSATATITPTPIPTINIEGQNIPDPHFTNPELFNLDKPNAPIPQFVHALNLAGVNVSAKNISESLIYKAVKAKNGDSAVLVMTTDLPETQYNEGNFPLLIYIKDSKTSEYAWGVAYLKAVASLHNILIGAVLYGPTEFEFNRQNGMFSNNFNLATIPWSSVDVPTDIMDRDTEYRLSNIANDNLKEIMWFHLSTSADSPIFISEDKAVTFINTEMDDVVRKYGDKMTIASVLNELNPTPPRTSYKMWKKFGDDYLIRIFQHAREILPNKKIIYNEAYNYSRNDSMYPYTVEVVNLLKAHHLIDAVGMQMHMTMNVWAEKMNIDETVSIMQEFGLPVYVTELDVNQTPMSGTDQEKLIHQAQIYENVVRACVRSGVCEIINFWGQTDTDSWYMFALNEPNSKACLFDENGIPKLAYYGVLRGLTEGYVPSIP